MKYSTGWWPPIAVCRSEMRLPRPKLTKLDLFFCKMYIPWLFRNKTFFLGSHFHFFGGQRDLFSEGITFFQNCGLFPDLWIMGGLRGNCNGIIGFIYMQWSITIIMIKMLNRDNEICSIIARLWDLWSEVNSATVISIAITPLHLLTIIKFSLLSEV